MSLALLLPLLFKMAIAAAIVVSVSLIAEKSKPFIAAMLATLPISAGPSLVFLALEHDDAFLSIALLGTMVTNIGTAIYILAYGLFAQRFATPLALFGAISAWALSVLAIKSLPWGIISALMASIIAYALMIPLTRRFLASPMPPVPPRAWYAIPLRAGAVALLAGTVTTLSWQLGPFASGLLTAFPIVLSSLIAILQPRIGGPATARVIVSGLPGLLGFALALALAASLSEPIGRFWALAIGLAVCLVWNASLVLWRNRTAQAV